MYYGETVTVWGWIWLMVYSLKHRKGQNLKILDFPFASVYGSRSSA